MVMNIEVIKTYNCFQLHPYDKSLHLLVGILKYFLYIIILLHRQAYPLYINHNSTLYRWSYLLLYLKYSSLTKGESMFVLLKYIHFQEK